LDICIQLTASRLEHISVQMMGITFMHHTVHTILSIGKLTEEHVPIWTVTLDVNRENRYAHKLIPIPGDGYYYFADNEYVHIAEDGTQLGSLIYDFAGLGIDPYLFDDSLRFSDATFTGTEFNICAIGQNFGAASNLLFIRLHLDGSVISALIKDCPDKSIDKDATITSVGDSTYIQYNYYNQIRARPNRLKKT